MRNRHVIAIFWLATINVSCVTSKNEKVFGDPVSWQTKDFSVYFHAGPSSFAESRTFSYYEVRPLHAEHWDHMIVSSALSTDGFRANPNPEPRKYIKIIADSRDEAFLIQERDPGGSVPWMNYIWIIRRKESGLLQHSYLDLPVKSGGNDPAAFDCPEVIALKGGKITYCYHNGQTVTVNALKVPTQKKPEVWQ